MGSKFTELNLSHALGRLQFGYGTRRGNPCPFITLLLFFVIGWNISGGMPAFAQAEPAATRSVDFTAFAGITGVYTGLSDGRNGAVTAGLDLNLPRYYHVRPSIEIRGTTPFYNGKIDSQKDILAGLKGEISFGRLHPYVDFLAGKGEITYVAPYVTYDGNFYYGKSSSTVLSPGVGFRYFLGGGFSAFGDVQLQYWNTPVSLSGHLLAKPLTAGLVYRFGPLHLRHRNPNR